MIHYVERAINRGDQNDFKRDSNGKKNGKMHLHVKNLRTTNSVFSRLIGGEKGDQGGLLDKHSKKIQKAA